MPTSIYCNPGYIWLLAVVSIPVFATIKKNRELPKHDLSNSVNVWEHLKRKTKFTLGILHIERHQPIMKELEKWESTCREVPFLIPYFPSILKRYR